MDAIPLGRSLTPGNSGVFLMKEKKRGIKISKDKANRLAIKRYLAILDFQETTIAPIAKITITKPMQSKVSEISENTIALSEKSSISFKYLAYTMSSNTPPKKTAAIQVYSPTIRKRNLSFTALFYQNWIFIYN